MRRTLIVVVLIVSLTLLLLSGCGGKQSAAIDLSTPQDGSSVTSLTPTLTWGGPAGAVFRLLVAADDNFQEVVLDAHNLIEDVYVVPSDLLEENQEYYWKVLAVSTKEGSAWSDPWMFRTPGDPPEGTGNIRVSAKLDGKDWSGDLRYMVSGPFSDSDSSVPWDFKDVAAGSYTLTYKGGGPAGAVMTGVTPAATLDLADGEDIHFVMNFATESTSTIKINATLDGQPWSGDVRVAIKGPYSETVKLLPETLTNLPAGEYTLAYKEGGPGGAVLNKISPAAVQDLATKGTITYTLNFTTEKSATLTIGAQLDGQKWSGPAQYSISGPVSGTYDSVPIEIKNAPAGQYKISYKSGGPAGAVLNNINPAETITINSGRTGGFMLNYATTKQTGKVEVRATLNGQPWSGMVDFVVSGAMDVGDFQVPRVYDHAAVGKYTVSYKGGGPENATLVEVSPASTQTLAQGKTVIFTLKFVEKSSYGTIYINAVLDGQPWETAMGSGTISYSLSGPAYYADNSIPNNYSSMPTGSYTLNYNSGGPTGAVLTGISPSPNQTLKAGGAITYTLSFSSQQKGTVNVNATINGEPWKGDLNYVLNGPYVESGSRVPRSFDNAPSGEYSVEYTNGGPPQSRFLRVVSSSLYLPAGGKINFTIEFEFIGLPDPMPGPLNDPDNEEEIMPSN
jgi:hypothetical protein